MRWPLSGIDVAFGVAACMTSQLLLSSAAVVIVAAMALALASTAHGTPVDTERLGATQGKKGWIAMLNFTGAYRSGNIDRLELGIDGAVQYQNVFPAHRGHPWRTRPAHAPLFFKDRWLLTTQVRWGKLDSKRFINSGIAHTRYTRMFIPRLGVEFFGQTQYNEFTLLGSPLILGTGARVDVVHRKRVGMWFGSGYMAEWEVNDTVDGDPHPARVLNHRWANRGVLQLYLVRWQAAVPEQPVRPAAPDGFRRRPHSRLRPARGQGDRHPVDRRQLRAAVRLATAADGRAGGHRARELLQGVVRLRPGSAQLTTASRRFSDERGARYPSPP